MLSFLNYQTTSNKLELRKIEYNESICDFDKQVFFSWVGDIQT